MTSKHDQHHHSQSSIEHEAYTSLRKPSGAWFQNIKKGRKLLGTFDSAVKLKPLYVGLTQFRIYGSGTRHHQKVPEGKWLDGLLVIGGADMYVYQVPAGSHEVQKAMESGASNVVTAIYYNLIQDLVRDGNEVYLLHVFDLDDARQGIMQMDFVDNKNTDVIPTWEDLKQQSASKIQMQVQELQLRFSTEAEAKQVSKKMHIQRHRIEDILVWMSNDYPVLTSVHPRIIVMIYKQYVFLSAESLQWGASVPLTGNGSFDDTLSRIWSGELQSVEDDEKNPRFRLYMQSPIGLLVAEFGLDIIAREMAQSGDKSFRLVAVPQVLAKSSEHVKILPSFGTLGMLGSSQEDHMLSETEFGVHDDELAVYAVVECTLKKELVHPKIIQTQSAQISKVFNWISQSDSELEKEQNQEQQNYIEKKQISEPTAKSNQEKFNLVLQKIQKEMLEQDQQSILAGALIVLAVVIISGICGFGFFVTLIQSILALFTALHIKNAAKEQPNFQKQNQEQKNLQKSDEQQIISKQQPSRYAFKLIQGYVVSQIPLDLAWQLGKDQKKIIHEINQIKEDKWFEGETKFCTADIKERYLVGAQNDKIEAVKRLKKTVNWRAQFKVDEILEKPLATYKFFKENLTFGMMGKNKQGYPMFLVKVSDLRKLSIAMKSRNFKTEEFGYLILFMNEYVWKHVENRNLPDGKMIYVMDLQGLRLMDMTGDPFQLMKELSPIGDHYPERLHRAYVLNVPRWFDFIWRLVSPLLEPSTQQRVQVFYKQLDQAKALSEEMGAEKLLVELGGDFDVPLLEHPDDLAISKYIHGLNPEI